MEPSPLVLQVRPDVFQQKVVSLYEEIFNFDGQETTEGFWKELFLLKPDKSALRQIIDDLSPEDLLSLQIETQQLFSRAVKCIKQGNAPEDLNALDTCTALMAAILTKKYTNPSSDIIDILAGLDEVDAIFTEFVAALDNTIRTGRSLDLRQKAIEVTLSVVSGAYQTSLLSYFVYRDLFLSLMKFIQDSDIISLPFESFTLLGLLANYNKFELQNPYQLRLVDFVNETTIKKVVNSVGYICTKLRGKYFAIQNDSPERWTLSNTLSKIGLGLMAPRAVNSPTPALEPEAAKEMFSKLPGNEVAILLATYDFAYANKLFCLSLVSLPTEKDQECPISCLISLTSYLLQHAHLSSRTTKYSHLSLLIIRILVEDSIICKRICSDENRLVVKLCRQKSPFLPYVTAERTIAASLLDAVIDGINHNIRRRLDVELYILCIGTIYRIISYLSRSRTRLNYHWSELFRSMFSLFRFLTTYVNDLKGMNGIEILVDDLVSLLALSISSGEAFLHNSVAYDDLFYKIVEAGEVLFKFRDSYELEKRPRSAIKILTSVSTHYIQFFEGESGKKGKQLTSVQVASVIRQGYESLSVQATEGLDSCDKYREADKRAFLKQIARCAVEDVRNLIREEN